MREDGPFGRLDARLAGREDGGGPIGWTQGPTLISLRRPTSSRDDSSDDEPPSPRGLVAPEPPKAKNAWDMGNKMRDAWKAGSPGTQARRRRISPVSSKKDEAEGLAPAAAPVAAPGSPDPVVVEPAAPAADAGAGVERAARGALGLLGAVLALLSLHVLLDPVNAQAPRGAVTKTSMSRRGSPPRNIHVAAAAASRAGPARPSGARALRPPRTIRLSEPRRRPRPPRNIHVAAAAASRLRRIATRCRFPA